MSFEKATVTELKKTIKEMGLEIPPNAVKKDLIKILEDEMSEIESILEKDLLQETDIFGDD